MATSVLLIKLVKKDTESNETFHMRDKLYKNAVKQHNIMVFSRLKSVYEKTKFVGDDFNNIKFFNESGNPISFEETVKIANDVSIATHSRPYPEYSQYNPYYDSGFDIFQPLGKMTSYSTPDGEAKSYELEPGTHLIGLGLKTAMYSIDILERGNLKAELLRRITIYDNLDNLEHNSTYENMTKYNMVRRFDWNKGQTPMPFKLHPRSSIYKKSIRQANCTGIIDTGYRGELCAAVDCLGMNFGKQTDPLRTTLEKNKRYFQICRADLKPFYVVLLNHYDELPSTERGEGGFGSTGH